MSLRMMLLKRQLEKLHLLGRDTFTHLRIFLKLACTFRSSHIRAEAIAISDPADVDSQIVANVLSFGLSERALNLLTDQMLREQPQIARHARQINAAVMSQFLERVM